MLGKLKDLTPNWDGSQNITVTVRADFREKFDELKDRDLDIEIKVHREKRSRNANRYLWALLDKMADVLHRTKEDLYLEYIRRYGMFRDFTLTPDEARTFRIVWEAFGTGWPTEQVDYTADGDHVVVRAYYGSSQYNSKRMARLIDAVIEDCEGLNIETMTPEELARLEGYANA